MSNYQSKLTNKFLFDLIDDAKKSLFKKSTPETESIDKIWTLIVGEKIASLTQVSSFNEGILIVNVQSSTLNNLLSRTEKPKIMAKFKKDFPFLKVKNLVFRSG